MIRLVTVLLIAALIAATCSSGDEGTEAFCDELRIVIRPSGPVRTINPRNPDSVRAALGELQSLSAKSPTEVQDDVATAIGVFELVVEALATGDDPDLVDQRLRDLDDDLASAGQATERIADYARVECGLELEAPTTTAPDPFGPSTTIPPASG